MGTGISRRDRIPCRRLPPRRGLGLLLLLLGGLTTSGGSSSATSGGTTGTDTGADVGDQLTDVDVLEGTGEEAGPEWLDIDRGGLEDGGDLVASDLAVVIVQDESGICAGELRGHIRNLLDNRNRTQKWDESH